MSSATLFHFYGLLHSSAALILFNTRTAFHKSPEGKPPQWRFLTSFNLTVQFLFFASGLYLDLVTHLTKFKCQLLCTIRDLMYASIVFPLSLFVFTNFWVLFELNSELIESMTIDKPMPLWCSHVFHTLILLVLFENHFSQVGYPSKKLGLLMNLFVSLCFASYIVWTHFETGVWGYRFMKIMRVCERAAFIAIQTVFFMSLYFFGELVNRLHDSTPPFKQVHTALSDSSRVFAGFSGGKKSS